MMKNQSEKTLEVIQKLRLMDDDLMSMVFGENVEATEYLLSVILARKDLKVLKVRGQREYKNTKIKGRKIRIDVYAKDQTGKVYNIEIQRSSKGAGFKRARYHSSMIDVRMLKSGQEFEEIHDSYVIFITEKDVIGMGLPVYHVDRTIEESGEKFEDGSHIIYVNGSYRNNEDEIGRLMHDFRCENSDEMLNSMLSDHVKYYKESKGGLKKMCELVEELVAELGEIRAREIAEERAKEIAEERAKEIAEERAKEMAEERAKEMAEERVKETAKKTAKKTAKETATRMLKKGKLSMEEIAEYSNLPLDVIKELREKI